MPKNYRSFFESVVQDFPNISPSSSYLDSAATTQKPLSVINAISDFYSHHYATVHRAIYTPAQIATQMYQASREKVARFLNATPEEIIFTKGTTDSLNIVADSFSLRLSKADTILVSTLEHHSNLIPWQMAAKRSGAKIVAIPILEDGTLNIEALKDLLKKENVALVALTACSNVIGELLPIEEIANLVHNAGAYLCVDGAQSIPHTKIDLKKLQCDIFCFSSHKLYGPTGIGVLYVRRKLLEQLIPTRGGGDMVDIVDFHESSYAPLPIRFEPGTPPIAEALGLQAALEYLESRNVQTIYTYEQHLYQYLEKQLSLIPEILPLGPKNNKIPLISFSVKGCHPLDIANLLNLSNVYIRSGNLCCQVLLKKLGLTAVNRISLGLYNSEEDIDRACAALKKAIITLSPTVFFESSQSKIVQNPEAQDVLD
jgi:cysteine desulfurase / selenocysteine lyase